VSPASVDEDGVHKPSSNTFSRAAPATLGHATGAQQAHQLVRADTLARLQAAPDTACARAGPIFGSVSSRIEPERVSSCGNSA